MLDGRGLPYHLLAIDFLFEDAGFLHQGGLVGGVLDGDEYAVEVQGFLYEIESTLLDAVDGGGDVPVPGNHYHSFQRVESGHVHAYCYRALLEAFDCRWF